MQHIYRFGLEAAPATDDTKNLKMKNDVVVHENILPLPDIRPKLQWHYTARQSYFYSL